MAYQTLPNTFVSGSTIYSTAVSGNMVALLQGYTSGLYDGNFSDVDVKEVRVNTAYYVKSAGTSNFGVVTCKTATVSGDVIATGDVARTPWSAYTVSTTNLSVSAATGYYRATGKSIDCSINILGKASSNGPITVSLPVTAAAATTVNGFTPMLWMSSASVAQQYPCIGVIAPDANLMYLYPQYSVTSFTSSVTYNVWGEFHYEGA